MCIGIPRPSGLAWPPLHLAGEKRQEEHRHAGTQACASYLHTECPIRKYGVYEVASFVACGGSRCTCAVCVYCTEYRATPEVKKEEKQSCPRHPEQVRGAAEGQSESDRHGADGPPVVIPETGTPAQLALAAVLRAVRRFSGLLVACVCLPGGPADGLASVQLPYSAITPY